MTNESEAIKLEQRHFEALAATDNGSYFRDDIHIALNELPAILRTMQAENKTLREQYQQQGLMISGALGASRNEDCETAALTLQARIVELESENDEYSRALKLSGGMMRKAMEELAAPAKPAAPAGKIATVEIIGDTVTIGGAHYDLTPAMPNNFEPMLSDGGDLIKSFSSGGGEFWMDRDGENYYRILADYLVECLQAIERAALLKAKAPVVGLSDEAITKVWNESCNTDSISIVTLREFARAIERSHGIQSAVAGSGEH